MSSQQGSADIAAMSKQCPLFERYILPGRMGALRACLTRVACTEMPMTDARADTTALVEGLGVNEGLCVTLDTEGEKAS